VLNIRFCTLVLGGSRGLDYREEGAYFFCSRERRVLGEEVGRFKIGEVSCLEILLPSAS
jgi:hypothetical protein